jgi:hypothetical protein
LASGKNPDRPSGLTIRTGPSAASAANTARQKLPREPRSPTGTNPPIRRTSPAVNVEQAISRCLPRSRGGILLGTLLRNTREQSTDLGLPVAPVPPQRAD